MPPAIRLSDRLRMTRPTSSRAREPMLRSPAPSSSVAESAPSKAASPRAPRTSTGWVPSQTTEVKTPTLRRASQMRSPMSSSRVRFENHSLSAGSSTGPVFGSNTSSVPRLETIQRWNGKPPNRSHSLLGVSMYPRRATRVSSLTACDGSATCSNTWEQMTKSNAPSRNGRASTSPTTSGRSATALTPCLSDASPKNFSQRTFALGAGLPPDPTSSTRSSAATPQRRCRRYCSRAESRIQSILRRRVTPDPRPALTASRNELLRVGDVPGGDGIGGRNHRRSRVTIALRRHLRAAAARPGEPWRPVHPGAAQRVSPPPDDSRRVPPARRPRGRGCASDSERPCRRYPRSASRRAAARSPT